MEGYIQIITTVPTRRHAEKIAGQLVVARFAACAQISGPIKSVYQWKGRIETAKEWVCVIKTKKKLYQKVENKIKEIHPYEVPEIISSPIIKGNKDYLKWLSAETLK